MDLRYGTAVIIPIGQFFDKTDGVTLETALTITNERVTFIMMNNDGSAPTIVLDNVTGATSGTDNDLNYISGSDNAMMQLELTVANTSYYGFGKISVTDAANHCPVWVDVHIISQNAFDAKYGTTLRTVNATQIGGTSQTGRDLGASVLLSSGTGTGQVSLASGAVTAGTVTDKTGYALSAISVDAILDDAVEGSITLRQMMRGIFAAVLNKLSGAATTTVSIRDAADTKDRVVATVDADGNRTAVTLDLT